MRFRLTRFTQTLSAERLTRVLYPEDSSVMGQGLRAVACSLIDTVHRCKRGNSNWGLFADKVATLVDREQLPWDRAWQITQNTLAYTNHTLLPGALETWPVA